MEDQDRDAPVPTTEEVVSDNAISESSTAPPLATTERTTWLTPWTWYYTSTSTSTNVEFHSEKDKEQHAAAAAEEVVTDRYADADDLQRESCSEAQPKPSFISDATTTTSTIAQHNANASPNGVHAPQHDL